MYQKRTSVLKNSFEPFSDLAFDVRDTSLALACLPVLVYPAGRIEALSACRALPSLVGVEKDSDNQTCYCSHRSACSSPNARPSESRLADTAGLGLCRAEEGIPQPLRRYRSGGFPAVPRRSTRGGWHLHRHGRHASYSLPHRDLHHLTARPRRYAWHVRG